MLRIDEDVSGILRRSRMSHAAAEEAALYPAGDTGPSELLVRAMRDEHRNLIAHVNQLRTASDGIATATAASRLDYADSPTT